MICPKNNLTFKLSYFTLILEVIIIVIIIVNIQFALLHMGQREKANGAQASS